MAPQGNKVRTMLDKRWVFILSQAGKALEANCCSAAHQQKCAFYQNNTGIHLFLSHPFPFYHLGHKWYSWNHRMVWVQRDIKNHPVPNACHVQGHLPLNQITQSHMQPGLGDLQGLGVHKWDSIKQMKTGISRILWVVSQVMDDRAHPWGTLSLFCAWEVPVLWAVVSVWPGQNHAQEPRESQAVFAQSAQNSLALHLIPCPCFIYQRRCGHWALSNNHLSWLQSFCSLWCNFDYIKQIGKGPGGIENTLTLVLREQLTYIRTFLMDIISI